jgi:hypothetical protein
MGVIHQLLKVHPAFSLLSFRVLPLKENPEPPHCHSDPDAIGGRISGRCGGLYPDKVGMTLLNSLLSLITQDVLPVLQLNDVSYLE